MGRNSHNDRYIKRQDPKGRDYNGLPVTCLRRLPIKRETDVEALGMER